jgi:UDP-GlcNAc:undecaprenyl-phosphate GlcNAc-1-phosphate transferase
VVDIYVAAGISLVASFFFEAMVLYLVLPMLQESGAVRPNFQGRDIPVSTGITFIFTYLIIMAGYKLLLPAFEPQFYLLALGLTALGFLGFLDDMLGGSDNRGFKGHFGALMKGRLTTGGLKALGGGFIAFLTALFIGGSAGEIILNTFIIALFTNLLNLLDLRPGRAIKGFLLFFIIIVLMAGGKVDLLIIAPLLGAVLYYFYFDLKALAMMGDAGSNVLGLLLGYLAAASLPLTFRTGVLLFLIAVHLFTEKYSISSTIERVGVLRFFDQLGRSQSDGK